MKGTIHDDDYRGHLPPPFYSGKDDYSRVTYLSEPRPAHSEDETMADHFHVEAARRVGRLANERSRRDFGSDYRHQGDRRWRDDSEQAWARELPYRRGYRSLEERMSIGYGHRGKGPRAYRRSDERILEDLNQMYYDDPFLDASDIETGVTDGEVVLTGTVEDRQSKRHAADMAETIFGVTQVENRLRVTPPRRE